MTHTKQKQFMVLWLSTELATIHPKMSTFISSDWSWWDSVSQSHLSIYASSNKFQRPAVTQRHPLLDGTRNSPHRSWNKRANMNILFLVYWGDNLFFYCTFTHVCGKMFCLLHAPSPPPPPKCITRKEIQRHSVWEVRRITQYYLS